MSLDNLSGSTGSLDYPEIRPSLDLNFARTKALDARVSFSRSSGGTYVGPDGLIKIAGVRQPRFDHDPITGECLGLMIEEGRINSVTTSNVITSSLISAYGTALNLISSGVPASPTGENIYEIPSSAEYRIIGTNGNLMGGNSGASTTWTYSIFVYPLPGVTSVNLNSHFGGTTTFNLNTLTITSTGGYTGTIQRFSNGWWRLSYTRTYSTSTELGLTIPGNPGYYFSSAQIEQGAFPTSYIPTAGAARTRAGESAGITGTNFNNFYNKTEGTAFIRSRNSYNQFPSGHWGAGFGFYRAGFSEGGWAFSHGRDRHVNIPNGYGADWRSLHPYIMSDTGNFSAGYPWNPTTFPIVTDSATTFIPGAMAVDSQTYIVASRGYKSDIYRHSGNMPNPVGLALGMDPNYSAYSSFSGTISNFTYWPKRLPINVLQNITK